MVFIFDILNKSFPIDFGFLKIWDSSVFLSLFFILTEYYIFIKFIN